MAKTFLIFLFISILFFGSAFCSPNDKNILFPQTDNLKKGDNGEQILSNFSFNSPVLPKYQIKKSRVCALAGMTVSGFVFGYDQATKAWGRPTGKFHFKKDWTGDGMAQNDEVSHLLWGYRLTQLFCSGYNWANFSPEKADLFGALESGFVLTFIEYPMDAYNQLQGMGVSDLVFNYLGIGTAVLKKRVKSLQNFDLKFFWKRNLLKKGESILVAKYEQFDNFVYWLTYKFNPFFKQKLFCFGLGYGTTHNIFLKPQRQIFLGLGLSLPDLFSLIGERFGKWTKPLDVFYPNLNIKVYQSP